MNHSTHTLDMEALEYMYSAEKLGMGSTHRLRSDDRVLSAPVRMLEFGSYKDGVACTSFAELLCSDGLFLKDFSCIAIP